MADQKKKSSVAGTVCFVIFAAMLIVGVYLAVTRTKDKTSLEADTGISEANTLISRDLEKDYPPTVREVMKFYCRITQCLYSDDLTDSQILQLVDKIRGLYSDELLAENDAAEMLGLVRGDILNYRNSGKTIQSYNIPESGEIKYLREEDPERAVINIYFTLKLDKEKAFDRSFEEFVLVKDKDDHWKILGWRLSQEQ